MQGPEEMEHNQASLLDHNEVAKVLDTDLAHGLSSFEASQRLKKYGPNRLADDQDQNPVRRYLYESLLKFVKQFLNPLIQLLLICAIVSAVVGEFENSISVAVSILIVCAISFIQEHRADRSLEKLGRQMPQTCKVIRDNQSQILESSRLVPGDVVLLTEGQRVPADVRLYDLASLTVNEANLTGETQSQVKISQPTGKKLTSALSGQSLIQEDKGMTIFQNLALMGTLVESGHSKGLVFSTGKSTRYGEVFSMLKGTVQPRSPIQNNIDQLSFHLVIISCIIIAAMSILGVVQKRPALEVAYYAISLAVTAIPEGLPVVVAVIMALGVIRLSKQKTIVKSLNSIETLGCIQVLCADKTGTLTRNDMSLTDIVTSELHSISSGELEELNREEYMRHMTFNKLGGKMYSIGRLMEVGTLCNNATFEPAQPELERSTGRYLGQATECAILEAALRLGFGDSRTKFDRLHEIPFSSSSRRMVVLCRRQDKNLNNEPIYYVKGAWEEILEDCKSYFECGLVRPKTEEMWTEYARVCATLGSQGLRVLAMATGPGLDELSFVGIVGISNKLREGIAETVGRLRNEFSLDVKMITGDSRPTALAVGRALGLVEDGPARNDAEEDRWAMSGEQLQQLLGGPDGAELPNKAQEILSRSVFYRVDPIQKANIVGKLQDLGRVVAMTGDGVNDVISLKRANLSLVMGSGADVCKEIADVILLEDDLSVLLSSVIEGKGIYHKIHSFLSYQISISLTLVVLIAVAFGFQAEPPFTVIQLLLINILADGPPAQSLGMEQINAEELSLYPRDVRAPLLSCHLLATLIFLTSILLLINGSLYCFLLDDGLLGAHGRTVLFTSFVFSTIFAALSLRSKVKTVFESRIHGNRELLFCCLAVAATQILIVQVEGLNDFFGNQSLPYAELLYVFLYAGLVLMIMDSLKVLVRLADHLAKLRHFQSKDAESSSKREA